MLPLDAGMLDGLPDPVFLVDQGLIVVDFNRAARRLLGEKALGANLDESLNNPHVIQAIGQSLSGAPGKRSEVFLPYPIARNFEFSVWRLPDLKSPGPVWAMVALHDITASKKADEMRADFVANVSHELRSPLSSLLGFIETLRGAARDDPAATERFLGIMESEAQRMTRLINELLVLSKLETVEHIRPEGTIDLRPVLNQVAATLGVRAKERGMDIAVDLPGDLPLVTGDPDELTQVFQNLLVNAVNYGRANSAIRVVVAARIVIPGTETPAVSVSVINLGDGIPPEDIPRLTERFYRVDKGRSRKMGGTGLGLAIVKHIVARHRGFLDIKCQLGHETSFTVYLPHANS
ncbi:MAG: ATP-binding protein [Proteobacteria bacterium]|nr:ATP-binding protein [Pseudomonadota bacterium]